MTHNDLPPATPPGAILEAAIYVDDLDAARTFYRDLVGLELFQDVEGRHLFFRLGATVLLVFHPDRTEQPPTNARMPVPPHGGRGPGHVCFALPREGIEAMATRLEAAGTPVDVAFDWPNGARSLYVRDPAGNSIEFAEPWLWDEA